jgi:hypothetical protein
VAERPIALPPEKLREALMPIRPFINGQRFDDETLRILGVTFELVCAALRSGPSDDDDVNKQ